jgi:hypothetical protein
MVIVTNDPELLHVTLYFVAVTQEIIKHVHIFAIIHRWRDKG